jgi:hypothetical protein
MIRTEDNPRLELFAVELDQRRLMILDSYIIINNKIDSRLTDRSPLSSRWILGGLSAAPR